jgi:hypothetical protein
MNVVDALKKAYLYCKQMRTYTLQHKVPGKHDKMVWEFARYILSKGVSPLEYVDWCFDMLVDLHNSIQLRNVCSIPMLNKFCAEGPDRNQQLLSMVILQIDEVDIRLRAGEKLDDILLDESAQIGAVVRFVMAMISNRPDLAKHFRQDFKEMVALRPYYLKLLDELLPGEVKIDV